MTTALERGRQGPSLPMLGTAWICWFRRPRVSDAAASNSVIGGNVLFGGLCLFATALVAAFPLTRLRRGRESILAGPSWPERARKVD